MWRSASRLNRAVGAAARQGGRPPAASNALHAASSTPSQPLRSLWLLRASDTWGESTSGSSCGQPASRRMATASADPSMELAKGKKMAGSAVNLARGSDRLAEAVKVSAPPPQSHDLSDGLSKPTAAFLARAVEQDGGTRPSDAYQKLVEKDMVTPDLHQTAALPWFDAVFDRVVSTPEPSATDPKSGKLLNRLIGGIKLPSLEHDYGNQRWHLTWKAPRPRKGAAVMADTNDGREPQSQGLYCYGGVGSGKTFLMDTFFYTLPIERKRRVHFLSFMPDVHGRVFRRRQAHGDEEDVLPLVAQELFDEAWVLCFDEFQVTEVADAMILARLFAEYFRLGGVVVATSNRPPEKLYENGLQRQQFIPFIETLKHRCLVHDMASTTDYRLTGELKDQVFMHPLSEANIATAQNLFTVLTKGEVIAPTSITSKSRTIPVPEAAEKTRTARFSFKDLCSVPLGATDYIAIARHYHTVFLTDIPILDTGTRVNETRRFITLIDTFYEKKVKLICTAAAAPHLLLDTTKHRAQEVDILGTAAVIQDNRDEEFAFERTVSRLMEMQKEDYLTQGHDGSDDEA